MPMTLLRNRAWMLFVDGENLTRRGQEVLEKAGIAPSAPRWLHDAYLWTGVGESDWTGIAGERDLSDLRRAYYYTSLPGQDWTDAQLAIRAMGFESKVFPRGGHKPAKGDKAKMVDIALATDVLVLGAAAQYEVAVIVSGDGDYVPVIEAVKRLGLHVGVASFEGSTSPHLRIAADEYMDLTDRFIGSWRRFYEHEEMERAFEARQRAAAET